MMSLLGSSSSAPAMTRTSSLPPKLAEFDVFASGEPTIGDNQPGSLLYAETLPRAAWDPDDDAVLKPIRNLVVVHRLREVYCLYGFTRFEAAPTAADGDLEDIRLAVHGAPLSLGADWLPAVEQFGEGLFIQFDEAAVTEWFARQLRQGSRCTTPRGLPAVET